MDNGDGLSLKNKIWIAVLSAVFLALICPILINEYFGIWEASAALSYYGTLLGATATIIAVTWTIITTKKSAELDRKHSMVVNHRNMGIKACYSLIEACDFIKLKELLENLNNQIDKNDFDSSIKISLQQNKFSKLSDEIKISHIKWQFIYPYIGFKSRNFIDVYVISYQKLIGNLLDSIECNGSFLWVSNEILDTISCFQKTHQPEFIAVLQRLSHEYDCESIWEHPLFVNEKDANVKEKDNPSQDN